MELEKAKEILVNVMADEVIGAYCNEIQKTVDCSKNCENEDCFLQQAIDTVLQELDRLQKENEKYISGELMTRNQAKHFEEITNKHYIHKNKIREKIEKIKNKPNNPNQKVIATQIDASLIACLQDLLKEEWLYEYYSK